MNPFRERLSRALALEHPYPEMAGVQPKVRPGVEASVLVLFEDSVTPSLLVTRRSAQVEHHPNQVSFPGGVIEHAESPEQAALREFREELGASDHALEIVGQLPKLWTVTGFWVTPIVAVTQPKTRLSSSEFQFRPNATEVESYHWVAWDEILKPEVYRREQREHQGVIYPVHYFEVSALPPQSPIWGVTGAMVQNLLERWRTIG